MTDKDLHLTVSQNHSGHVHFVFHHKIADFRWQVISRRDDLLSVRKSVHSPDKDDQDSSEESEGSLESS